MRIAIISYEFPPSVGGISEYVGQVAWRLAQKHEVGVWAPPPYSLSVDDEVHPAPPYQRFDMPRTLLGLRHALSRWHPDRILVGHTELRLLAAAWLVARTRYMAIAYGNDFLGAQRTWHRPLVNYLLAHARPLITISQSSARRLHMLGIPNPVVIYPGTDPQRFHPPAEPPSGPFTLLSVGRLLPRKGVDTAIRALAQLREEYADLQYLIAGRGPERPRLQRLARDLGVEDRVQFLGGVPASDLPDIYRQAHVFVLPLREEAHADSVEGFGMVFLEAAATAIPSVAGNSGGAAEAVRDGETGFLVPPSNVSAVVESVRRLLDDEVLRLEMGHNGRRWVEEEMNWDRVVRDFEHWL